MKSQQVKDIMERKVVACIVTDSVSLVAKKLRKSGISGMPVMDGDKLVGIITESDILRLLRNPEYSRKLWLPSPLELIEVPIRELVGWVEMKKALENIGNMPVRDIMTKQVYTISPSDSLERAAEMMTKHDINRLPVIEGGKLVGIVTRGDIIAGLGGEGKK
ncbi:MAG TPA: CBS domain-containing protein [Methanocellales archaeon]|nr:CBS domain-containing protein [Methanocellales archaeon]